ncbi:MAG TPA: response regulator, partial [Rheinheimera sp.]|nr:response regulator [Rheinheimera sp.]
IAQAYMLASNDVFQVRLIHHTGKELVRAERKGNSVLHVPETQLQNKADRPYFVETLKLTNGAVFTSDIEPNSENGKIERPIRPTWRFATPLLSKQNKPFGIIVINVDVSYTFSLLHSHISDKEFIYLTAVNGDFVLSPNQQETFASSQNTTLNWDKKYTSARAPYGLTDNSISTWHNQNSAIIAARQNFKPNYASSAGSIGIFATYDIAEIYDDLLTFSASMTLALVLLGSVGSVLVYFNWLSYLRAAQARRINQQLAEQRSKDKMFESLTELSPEAMIICDIAGNIVLVNSQAEKLYSYSRHEMIGNRIDMLLPERIKPHHQQHMAGFIQAPRNRAMGDGKELFSIDAFGLEFPVEVSLSPIQLDDRMLIASSVRNISERKTIEQSLNNAIAEAKRASAAKGAFLANMSHEIRTPLNAVIGLTHLLKEQNLAPAQVSLVDKIALAGRSLLGIVNDVLDLAKIEANELTINEVSCNLKTLLEELHSVFSTQAEAKGLQFILTIDESTPPYVITDATMLRQILTNLLGNALKFTKQGHIQLKVEPVDATDLPSSQAMLRFAVIDTGIGISKAAQDKIFLPFNQEDDSTNRRFGGTGLGLSIVSNMTAILRGTLGVNSEPGIGSEFWLQLPMAVQDEPDETDLSNTDSLLIMLAEDNDDDRERLEQMSKSLGWRVEAFSDGEALVRAYDSKYQNNQPLADVLVLDWQMPTMDGITAIYKLHDQYGIENLPAILVISAYEIDNIKALDVKRVVNHYLHKPITSSDLFNAVHEVVVKHTGNTDRVIGLTKVDAIKAKWLPGVKVLVVDDSQINLEVVESILKLNGAEVTTAESGASAIEYIRNHHAQIDIVLMDVQMPIMDGLEATTYIRKALKLQALPIIALTAGTLEEERKNAIFAGMDDFLTKPIEPPKLINTIRKAVQKYRRTSIAIESLETKDAAGTNTDWPKIEGLMDNRHMFQGNQKLFTQTLRRLLNEFNWLDAGNSGPMLDQGSTEQRLELAGQLHKLKGIAGMIGSKRLYELASEAEVALRKTSNDVSDLVSALSETMRILRVNAERYLDEDAEKAKQELHNQQDAVAFTPEQLQAFIQALQNNDMSAVITADEHKSALWTMLGNEQHQAFFNLLDDLQFKQAAQLLKDKSGL